MSEITKNQMKLIRSLHQKKGRKQHGLFVVEGKKNVNELIQSSFEIEMVFGTSNCDIDYPFKTITNKDLNHISHLKTPDKVIALAKIKEFAVSNTYKLTLVLDTVNDPGNLGTIIRTADWFGVDQIICSPDTVDCYNPKVVQSTKGSIFHTPIIYQDISSFLENQTADIYGASLDGETSYSINKNTSSILLIGSESHGISEQHLELVTKKIKIPRYGKAESLNVGIATGILLNEFTK